MSRSILLSGMRFTIRDVLWLTVVIGLGLALYRERTRSWELNVYASNLDAAFNHLAIVMTGDGWEVTLEDDAVEASRTKDGVWGGMTKVFANPSGYISPNKSERKWNAKSRPPSNTD